MMEKSQPVPPPAYTLRTTPEGLQTVKLWIRFLSAAICTILIGVGIKLGDVPGVIIILLSPASIPPPSQTGRRPAKRSSDGRQAGVTLIWNVAVIMVRHLRRNGQDIHPGTRVGVDLIVWLGFGAVAVMMAATWSTWDTNMAETHYDGVKFVLVQMAVVLATIEALVLPAPVGIKAISANSARFVHIALFIIACHETHVHNRYKKFIRKVRAAEKHAVDGGKKEEI
ncbi:hypothetical protein MAC_04679 [Metarhizium acridum CQMa 102]|uniref:Uncharacterized protein n=1 Tax=Metarhizium acridum (strain CQMa 102) TaxID=655827 RepID=E9E481_METAQ|nr:uncharacterized protein MAC_04679 [Metarhizium acridum CQMa 102]EFY89298.1 hypothetical protein MAC_04679 [Metarhizium acridum CQMa 102]